MIPRGPRTLSVCHTRHRPLGASCGLFVRSAPPVRGRCRKRPSLGARPSSPRGEVRTCGGGSKDSRTTWGADRMGPCVPRRVDCCPRCRWWSLTPLAPPSRRGKRMHNQGRAAALPMSKNRHWLPELTADEPDRMYAVDPVCGQPDYAACGLVVLNWTSYSTGVRSSSEERGRLWLEHSRCTRRSRCVHLGLRAHERRSTSSSLSEAKRLSATASSQHWRATSEFLGLYWVPRVGVEVRSPRRPARTQWPCAGPS